MNVYLAGNTAFIAREAQMLRLYDKRLFSFFYVGPEGAFQKECDFVIAHKREEQNHGQHLNLDAARR